MALVLADGHTILSGLKATLEMFYGPAQACQVDGLSGWQSGGEEPVYYSRIADGHLTTLAEEQGFQLTEIVEENPKRQIKRQMYKAMAAVSGKIWPWGSLTGIRPTYVAAELLARVSEAEAIRILVEDYSVSPAKAELAIETAEAELALLRPLAADDYAVYIGVPFCPGRCSYCSFTTQEGIGTADRLGDAYLDRLEEEIRNAVFPGGSLRSVYVGGGTPAALTENQFPRLLELIRKLPVAETCEITVEIGRADVISSGKLKALADAGIRRICLNPQTMHDETMQRINRCGSAALYRDVFRLAREAGMEVINMDLIAGLPGESGTDFLESVEEVLRLHPDAVTLHTLARKKGSDQSNDLYNTNQSWLPKPDPEWTEALAKAQNRLKEAKYQPYYLYRHHYGLGGLENLSYAKPGAETLYNIQMMSDSYTVLGFGCPAVTKYVDGRKVRRVVSPKNVRNYINS